MHPQHGPVGAPAAEPCEPLTQGEPTVSIVTVTYNAAGIIRPFLDAIAALAYAKLEVIIVDNASRDETAQVVRQTNPEIRVVQQSRNLGFAGASNVGARYASGEILLFLNPDTIPPKNTIARLAAIMTQRPTVGALGCKLVYRDGRIQSAGGMIGVNGHCVHRGYGTEDDGSYDNEAAVDYVPGAALAIRRAVFWSVGGFYRGYFPGYYEDTELCLELRRRGLEVRYVPVPRIVHLEGTTMAEARHYWINRNRLIFLVRNGDFSRAPAALRQELRWLREQFIRPLIQSVRWRPENISSDWERLRPVLHAMLSAITVAPAALWHRYGQRRRQALSSGDPHR